MHIFFLVCDTECRLDTINTGGTDTYIFSAWVVARFASELCFYN